MINTHTHTNKQTHQQTDVDNTHKNKKIIRDGVATPCTAYACQTAYSDCTACSAFIAYIASNVCTANTVAYLPLHTYKALAYHGPRELS